MPKNEEGLEEGCFAITFERKYYRRGGSFIKRTLRPTEFRTGYRGLHVPRLRMESLMNEAESLRYIRQHTDIPVPRVYCDFEDDDAYYLVTEYVEGVGMSDLSSDDQKAVVRRELESHLATLKKTLTFNRLGGPSGIVIPPYRVLRRTEPETDHQWRRLKPSDQKEYVFCHNDLSQQYVIVDPDTLKINAIIDWEYAGFYPASFEWPFYTRLGPSVAVKDEVDDSLELLEFLESQRQSEDGD
ncbi:kinase-like protein [Xylariaceae sp. FL0594]|nr:kinase-like protein [Xylariaceae sp. FL0594]